MDDKQDVRERIWQLLQDEGAARFPGARGRIPNFKGAEAAAERLAELPEWQAGDVVKSNPDAPQLPVRRRARREGKTLYMAVPRLRDDKPFVRVESDPTIKKAMSAGIPTSVEDLGHVDLVVCGTVAVNREGVRVGKGGGFSDLELALLTEAGLVDDATTIVTTVHGLQLVDEELPETEHDFRVEAIDTGNAEAVAGTETASADPSIIELAEDCTYTLTAADNRTDGGNGLPVIVSNVAIDGNGATITRSSTWSQFRIIEVASGGTLSVSDLTVSGGHAADGPAGWIRADHGAGGDGANGGGILNAGTLTLADTTVSDNQAGDGGRGARAGYSADRGGTGGSGGDGGGIFNAGTLTLAGVAVTGNQAGGGGRGGKGDYDAGSVGGGGGTGGSGGGIDNAGTLDVTNASVADNRAGSGGRGGRGDDTAGVNTFRFSGRINGRSLPAGDYELALTAERGGRSSRTVTVRFRVLAAHTRDS